MDEIRIKRVYADYAASDGCRVLVDRLWPRGLSKSAAKLDLWMQEIAPSTALRKWFGHDAEKWIEFRQRYVDELERNHDVVAALLANPSGTVTLLYSASDTRHNQAVVLRDYLRGLVGLPDGSD